MSEPVRLNDRSFQTLDDVSTWFRDDAANVAIYVAVAAGVYLLLLGLRNILRRAAGAPEAFKPHSWREIAARLLNQTRSFFLVAIAAQVVTASVDAPATVARIVAVLFTAATVIQGAIWLREFVLAIIARRAALADPAESTLASAMGVVNVIVSIVIWAIALILILDNLGINVTALVAGLGIGGIAIGLAAQGIFSDLFAALSILFDKPFRRGDSISVDGLTGTVEAIGLKTTRLRALSGELVAVSNAKLLENRIHNFALLPRRREVMQFGIVYQTPPEVLARIPGEIEGVVRTAPETTFDRAHVFRLGSSSIDIELVFHVESQEYEAMMNARQAVVVGLLRRFAELKIEFAYPTQTSFTAAPDGRYVMPYPEPRRA